MQKLFIFILTALYFTVPFSFAQTDDNAWLTRSQQIMADPESYMQTPLQQESVPQKQVTPQHEQIAAELAKKSQQALLEKYIKQEQGKTESKLDVVLMVTFGKPVDKDGMRALMRSMAGEDVTLAIQGLPVGMRRIDEVVSLMGTIGDGIKGSPGLVIDPRHFEKTNTTTSPTIVVEMKGEPLVWAQGVSDPAWILDRYNHGERGDLGVYGSVEEVTEKSLTQEIHERIAKIDWEKKKAQAGKRFWQNRQYLDVPVTTRPRAFEFTLEYEIHEDMPGKDGELMARAGDKINPVTMISGSFYLVVFDASDSLQLAKAKELGANASTGKHVKYLATRMDPGDDGWEEKVRIEDELDAPLYFISEQQASILRVQHVPATVQVSGNNLLIMEYLPLPTDSSGDTSENTIMTLK